MDDELTQLEAELKRLQPVPPSRALSERIETSLASRPVRRSFPFRPAGWFVVAGLPAAAAVVLLLQNPTPPDRPTRSVAPPPVAVVRATDDAPLKPVSAERVLVSANDEGLVTLEDGTPARRERLHFVDTITWRNTRTNASLKWSMPREEVRVVPVAFQ